VAVAAAVVVAVAAGMMTINNQIGAMVAVSSSHTVSRHFSAVRLEIDFEN